jgi:hypothetical protein
MSTANQTRTTRRLDAEREHCDLREGLPSLSRVYLASVRAWPTLKLRLHYKKCSCK